MVEQIFKKVNFEDTNLFENIQVNNKITHEDCGEERQILVIRKNERNFYGAYRTKDILQDRMINVNTYHLLSDGKVENFGADNNYQEKNFEEPENVKEFHRLDSLLKSFEM